MTPAEFDTLRRSLGLSVDETAALCGVQDRTVRRWQSGASTIPDEAEQLLADLEDAMGCAVENVVELASDMTSAGPIVLWRYRTAEAQAASPHASSLLPGAHAMMIGWSADALRAEGIDVRIEWADPS